jgi:predicted nucleic-acid-binding protein
MASLDTNCLLRWLLGDDPSQAEIVQRVLDSGESLAVHDIAIIEICFVLERHYGAPRAAIADSVRLIMAQAVIVMDRSRWSSILDDYLAHPKLSAVDLFLVHQAKDFHELPLFTFDRKLANQIDGAELLR